MKGSFHMRSLGLMTVGIFALIGMCLVSAPANAVVHEVEQVGLEFVPAELTVAPGDTVRWTWTSGLHTVTSGSNCTFDGIHFDAPLNSGHPTAEYVIPGDFSGTIDYFCEPHCTLGMAGVITVEASCPADFDGDGAVTTADLLTLLGAWGTSEGDVDGDGDTDTADLLELLGAWGACP
ncbi:MAG: plastocyanin/azurin family copper-binding protein [Planctomycetota bacterium]|nr:plastocyanin/azurin family copper-binding protein [Planctomycetota bacterium]